MCANAQNVTYLDRHTIQNAECPAIFLQIHLISLHLYLYLHKSWNWKPNLRAHTHTHSHIWTHFNRANEQIQLNGLANELVLNKLVWRALCACTTLMLWFFRCFFFHSSNEIHSKFLLSLTSSIFLVSISINTNKQREKKTHRKESASVCARARTCVHLSIRHRCLFFSMKLDEFCFIVWFDSVENVMGRSSPFLFRYRSEWVSEYNRIRFDDYSTFLWFLLAIKA